MNIKQTKKNIRYGVVGGIAGAFIGVPGLGVAAGLVAANKDKIKKSMRGK